LERRLAAILAADVVGYSRLVGADEEGTLKALRSLRSDFIEPVITEHRGRIVKLMGDGFLVEFPSAVDAMKCAIAWQTGLAEQPTEKEFNFRMGINLGDIVIDGDDILGDGVNIAARLEGLAEPGSIVISDTVKQNVLASLDLDLEDLGEKVLKNIERKVRSWQLSLGHSRVHTKLDQPEPSEVPSIAILPLKNLSKDTDEEFLCDGIIEDVATALCKIDRLFVIASSSTANYKSSGLDLAQIGQEQGVRYVLTGSLRKLGNRVRVAIQLIDTRSGRQIFAERYDNESEDIFRLQDEIARGIITALQIKLTDGEQARLWASGTQSFEAWQLCFQAAELVDKHVREDTAKALTLLERAVSIDPEYATAWCKIGWVHWSNARHHWVRDISGACESAKTVGRRALAIDPNNAEAFSLLAMTAMQEGDFEEAARMATEGAERAAGQAFVLAILAMVLAHCGRVSMAIELNEKAMELCPIFPGWFRVNLGRAYYLAGDLDRAVEQLYLSYRANPSAVGPVLLTAALYDAGRVDEAKSIVAEMMSKMPNATIADWARDQSYKDPHVVSHITDVMRELGMPE
jgi:adenylate cyclase